MGFARVAPRIVMTLNTLTMIFGLITFAGAIYVSVTPEYAAFFPTSAIWVAGAAGILIFLVSLFGCFAVYKDYRKLLGLYTLLVIGILAMQIAGAYLYSSYYNYIKAGTATTFNSNSLTDPNEIALNNDILSIYTTCCFGCPPIIGFCTGDYAAGAPQQLTQFCTLPNLCLPAFRCVGTSSQNPCYQKTGTVEANVPSFKVDPAVCTNLAITRVNSTANAPNFVGASSTGGCGGGSPAVFQRYVYLYASSKLVWVLAIASIVAALEFLLVFASISALCARRERKN